MKPWLGFLSVCLISQNLLAEASDESLSLLHSQSDVIVLGEFASEPLGEVNEPGVVGYHDEFKITQLLKGVIVEERKPGGTISVNMVRFEFEAGDQHPLLAKGGKAILFLKANNRQSRVTYTIFDKWLGIQPAFPTLAKTLASMSDKPTSQSDPNLKHLSERGRREYQKLQPLLVAHEYLDDESIDVSLHNLERATVARYAVGQPTQFDWLVTIPARQDGDPILIAVTKDQKAWRLNPANLERWEVESQTVADDPAPIQPKQVDLSGDWRIFLPAGYELEISLKSLGDDRYTLLPATYTFSGTYRIEGDRLVSEETDDNRRGQFAWKIVSDYLTTLVDQVEGVGSSYDGAIMFRLCPTAILERQQAKAAKLIPLDPQRPHLKGVQQITVEQLREQILEEGFQWRFIGREIEFTSSQRKGNRVHIDGMEKEILDTAVIHLAEAKADRELLAKLGERIRVRGLIVDQWYGVWQIWPYSMTDVKEAENQTQPKAVNGALD